MILRIVKAGCTGIFSQCGRAQSTAVQLGKTYVDLCQQVGQHCPGRMSHCMPTGTVEWCTEYYVATEPTRDETLRVMYICAHETVARIIYHV